MKKIENDVLLWLRASKTTEIQVTHWLALAGTGEQREPSGFSARATCLAVFANRAQNPKQEAIRGLAPYKLSEVWQYITFCSLCTSNKIVHEQSFMVCLLVGAFPFSQRRKSEDWVGACVRVCMGARAACVRVFLPEENESCLD